MDAGVRLISSPVRNRSHFLWSKTKSEPERVSGLTVISRTNERNQFSQAQPLNTTVKSCGGVFMPNENLFAVALSASNPNIEPGVN